MLLEKNELLCVTKEDICSVDFVINNTNCYIKSELDLLLRVYMSDIIPNDKGSKFDVDDVIDYDYINGKYTIYVKGIYTISNCNISEKCITTFYLYKEDYFYTLRLGRVISHNTIDF